MDLLSLASFDYTLPYYKILRAKGRELNQTLVEQIPRFDLFACAKELGILKGKTTVVLGNPDEISVLVDYCIYSHRRGGRTLVQRYFEKSPPPPGSDEMTLLQAMLRSHYSIFAVAGTYSERGAVLQDLMRDSELFLMDQGIGSTAKRGAWFAGRVLPFPNFYMTSGAFIPLFKELVIEQLMPVIERFVERCGPKTGFVLSHRDEAKFSAQIIRRSLRAGALDNMVYADPEEWIDGRQ